MSSGWINSKIVFDSMQANIQTGQNTAINNTSSHNIFIVAYGTWNYSSIYIVFPNNGNAPISRLLASHSGQDDDKVSFSANGSWGIIINNTSQYEMPVTVIKLKKG